MFLSRWFQPEGWQRHGAWRNRFRTKSKPPRLEILEDRCLLSLNQFPVPTPDTVPMGITAGPDHALWFTESGADQVGRISLTGKITEWSNVKVNLGSRPEHISAGPDGALWFTEPGSNKIGRLTTDFQYTEYEIPTPDSNPQAIVAGPDGAMWFTERNVDKIGVITMDGKVFELSVPWVRPGLSGLQGITLGPDGAVWFTEQDVAAIGRVSLDGAFTEYPLGEPGDPYAIVTGPDGNLWFTEQFRTRVGRLTPSGDVTLFGEPGLNEAFGDITPGRDNSLWYVVNITVSAPLIRRLTVDGAESDVVLDLPTGYPGIGGITVGPDDNIWFTETVANQMGQWTSKGLGLRFTITPISKEVREVQPISLENSLSWAVQPIDIGELQIPDVYGDSGHSAHPVGVSELPVVAIPVPRSPAYGVMPLDDPLGPVSARRILFYSTLPLGDPALANDLIVQLQ